MVAPFRTPLYVLCACLPAAAQGRGGPAFQLDLEGRGEEARAVFQKAIDSAATPQAKAGAERNMAMSWAFDGNCKKTAEYEDRVIEFWKTREAADPGNAFYQEGEMADEAARVCLDYGDLDTAEAYYKKGHDLGMSEPAIPAGRKDLWAYRYRHAMARLAARRGDKNRAQAYVIDAKMFLDKMGKDDPPLYRQQLGFWPYLTGYIAFYSGDYKGALADFEKDPRADPFIQCMIGMSYEKLGDKDKAMEAYRRAANAGAHNPPAAFARPFARKKLGA